MHASMLAANPPIRYWRSTSIDVLDACDELRRSGVAAYETMDAGPQVKIATTVSHVDRVVEALTPLALAGEPLVCSVTDEPRVLTAAPGGSA
jgi:diphosphomevalonate decarboxylase